ncbi:maltase 2-like [Cylas formicarius]|uniref:maltase 2-like n=1 Tax=Cylas formicarius TaxID=197179 RepID=UPI002958B5D3|nr:maltase 2-like [Cylas formicarius]
MASKLIFLVLLTWTVLVNAEISKRYLIKSSTDDGASNDDEWWKTAVFYQIYPRSFMDSNKDGNGDIQGIIQRFNHLKDMGVSAAWLSPIFRSPQVDQGYDISDYRDIDPIFGTISDLKELIKAAHDAGIKIILDFVPNHTSSEHDWFIKSIENDEEYKDFYIWRDAKIVDHTRYPPNNWVSLFKGSAWTWNELRQQYYLHQFSAAQPDLNYRNPKVVAAMKEILLFWLDFGADGFRMDAVPYLFEDDSFSDEPLSGVSGYVATDYEYLKHPYTKNLDETYDMIYQWRRVLDDFNVGQNYSRIMMTEAYTETQEDAFKYYGSINGTTMGAHFTFNFNLISDLKAGFTADDLIQAIDKWLSFIPEQYSSNWVLGNHDNSRVATRLGVQNVDAFNMLAAFLPGIQVTYNGEEIGMEDGEVSCQQGYDPQATKNCTTFSEISRDFERTPFQWDTSSNAGFSEAESTWLPVSEKYLTNNLAAQNVTDLKSHYNLYKSLIRFRENFKNVSSDALSLLTLSDNVIQIVRRTDDNVYSYVFNAGNSVEEVQIWKTAGMYKVALASTNSSFAIDDDCADKAELGPHDCVILKLETSMESNTETVAPSLAFLGFAVTLTLVVSVV